MAKFKVTLGTRTVWLQETKQANFELEDGRVLGIRVMEDDNGSETHYCLKDKGEEIFKRDNWINSYDMNWESEELKAQVDKLSFYIFGEGYVKDEVVETDDLEDIWL